MAVRFNKIVSAEDIPDASWDKWMEMGYAYPIDYLREKYGATEVSYSLRKEPFWREVRFRSRKSYMEFYLTWM